MADQTVRIEDNGEASVALSLMRQIAGEEQTMREQEQSSRKY